MVDTEIVKNGRIATNRISFNVEVEEFWNQPQNFFFNIILLCVALNKLKLKLNLNAP